MQRGETSEVKRKKTSDVVNTSHSVTSHFRAQQRHGDDAHQSEKNAARGNIRG